MVMEKIQAELGRLYAVEVKEGYEGVPLIAIYGAFMTFLFFAGAIVFPVLVPAYRGLSPQLKVDWRNRAVAFVHASIMTYLAFRYWILDVPLWKVNFSSVELPAHLGMHEKSCLRLMTGYMIYDLAIELITPEKYDWPVLFHHVAGLMSHVHTIAVDDEPSAFYTMMVYLAESSTPFLHMGWFLKTLRLDGSPLFMLNAVLILLTYIVTRVGLSPLLLYTFLHPNNHHHYDGRPYVWGFQAFICVAFMTLNYMWFGQLMRLFMKAIRGTKGEKKKE